MAKVANCRECEHLTEEDGKPFCEMVCVLLEACTRPHLTRLCPKKDKRIELNEYQRNKRKEDRLNEPKKSTSNGK